MPKLLSSKKIIQVLLSNGFVFVSKSESHSKYRKSVEVILTVIVPSPRKEIPYGTFKSILRQSKLNESDFE